jgi:hypothetical protein
MDGMMMNNDFEAKRRGRNIALAGLLFLFVALVFAITMVKLQGAS